MDQNQINELYKEIRLLRQQKMSLNKWDIAWGVAYGTLIITPLMTFGMIMFLLFFGETLLPILSSILHDLF